MHASVVPQGTKALQRRRSICVQTLTLDLRTGKVTTHRGLGNKILGNNFSYSVREATIVSVPVPQITSSTIGRKTDYLHKMRGEIFILVLKEELIPQLDPNSIHVIQSAFYRNTQNKKTLTPNSKKETMKICNVSST